jgi:hypothetical protein
MPVRKVQKTSAGRPFNSAGRIDRRHFGTILAIFSKTELFQISASFDERRICRTKGSNGGSVHRLAWKLRSPLFGHCIGGAFGSFDVVLADSD